MERFNKKQAITELDVTTGTPVTEPSSSNRASTTMK